MKTALLLLACFFSFSINAQTSEKDSLADAFHLIDTWLEAQVQYDNIPGLSVAIVKDQELIWSKAYGHSYVEQRVAATPKTIYSICSISKLFTSIAIMNLYEEGKLRLDDPVSEHLSGFNIQQKYEQSGPITIRSILTHSSGLPRESDTPYWTGPDFPFPSREQVKEELGKQETLYTASTYFQYSNLGMSLLGEVIEEVSGMPYDQYIKELILQPLQLNYTKPYLPQEQWGQQLAMGYSAVKRDGSREKVKLFDARGIKAAAGFSSTVEDLAKFASWQFRLLNNGKEEILKPSTLKEMQRVHWVDPDFNTFWGLGFAVQNNGGEKTVGHGGSCPGYRTVFSLIPAQELSVVVMMNAMDNPGKYGEEIVNILKKAKAQKEEETAADLSAYTGIYNYQPWASEVHVAEWFGQLAVIYMPSGSPSAEMTLLTHEEGDTFRRMRDDKEPGEEVLFERNQAGKVTKMWRHSNAAEKL
ncbi:serine hydrolase [Salinimicrobium xinjiangense]|uniref:serine hydrolase n=1 Tax=Salinimicrobium xinjiangense TaxID=438596 RepID=UPI00041DF7D7|nr:serine hydrolase [Salinimicrobium xinjiangense]